MAEWKREKGEGVGRVEEEGGRERVEKKKRRGSQEVKEGSKRFVEEKR